MIVCHEKVVRIPLEGDEILPVHGERTQGVVKTLMNTKVDEPKLSDISVVQDFIDVFSEDLSMTTTTKMGDALSRKERVKSRRVKGMILAAQSEVFKQENVLAERLHGLDQQMERKGDGSWNDSGDDQLVEMDDLPLWCLADVVVLVKERPKAVRDRQKSYVDYGRKPLELRLRLPEELNSVHDTFHVSNLKKCLADTNLHLPLNEIKIDKTLRFVVEPVEIMDRKVKSLKCSRISLVKVHWNLKRGLEFTWERGDYMKSKYP
ncbi:hypothetical protein Tco_0128046 [Tanacetum coccineum]